MDIRVKTENPQASTLPAWKPAGNRITPPGGSKDVINLSSSDDEESEYCGNPDEIAEVESADRTGGFSQTYSAGDKRARDDSNASPMKRLAVVVPEEEEDEGFCRSVPPPGKAIVALPAKPRDVAPPFSSRVSCKQFWKARDYEEPSCGDWKVSAGGFDHVRVHPKFLHSNATSHKWALGAFAELLDNALDEV